MQYPCTVHSTHHTALRAVMSIYLNIEVLLNVIRIPTEQPVKSKTPLVDAVSTMTHRLFPPALPLLVGPVKVSMFFYTSIVLFREARPGFRKKRWWVRNSPSFEGA